MNFMIPLLRAYMWISDMCESVKKNIDYFTSSIPSKWVFLYSSTAPIPIGAYNNSRYDLPKNIEYVFDTYYQTLCLNRDTHVLGKLPFLSGTLTVGDRTFSLDEFIEKVEFEITKDKIPLPLVILRCWSILNGVWFCYTNQPIFNLIDMEGNEHEFDVFSDTFNYTAWGRLLLGHTSPEILTDEDLVSAEILTDEDLVSAEILTDASLVSAETPIDAEATIPLPASDEEQEQEQEPVIVPSQ